MLDPNTRILLTDAIAPDPGYTLDHALFTSFTLDLTTLMEIPVALTFQEWKARDPNSRLSRIAVLDAIQRNVGKMTAVSQAGCITGPAKGHPLLPLLEPAIHPLVMPEHSTFHPKVTLIRYLADTQALGEGSPAVTYRLVSSSRNLSQSRAWDTIVVLDGVLTDRRQSDAKGLRAFVSGVAEIAQSIPTGMEPDRASILAGLADEAPRVDFKRPSEIKDGKGHMEMVPIGFGKRFRPEPIRNDQKRLLITPFLGGPSEELKGDRILESFASKQTTLISRQSELDRVPEELIEQFGEVLVLSDLALDAEDDSAGSEEPADNRQADLRGLHAKLIVEDDGHNSRILIGSPNISVRAFSQNREFALKLTVSKYLNGVEKILGSDSRSGLRKYLQEYVRSEVSDDADAARRAVERKLEVVADQLIQADLALRLEAPDGEESDHRDVWIEAGRAPHDVPDDVSAEARPVSLDPGKFAPIDWSEDRMVSWAGVSIPSLTSLIAIRLSSESDDGVVTHTFVTKVRLADPLPEARDRMIVRRLIDSSNQLLNYLAFLLSGSADPSAALQLIDELSDKEEQAGTGTRQSGPAAPLGLPLMEKLAQAVDRDPSAIDSISSIVNQLEQDEEGQQILVESGFLNVWKPVAEAHRRRREVAR